MFRVYYSLEGQSFGREFLTLDLALSFAEDDAGAVTVVDSDGVHTIRRFQFRNGTLTSYEVNRNGRMVDLLNKENAA